MGATISTSPKWRKVERGVYESPDGQWRVVNPRQLDTSLRHRWIIRMLMDDGEWFALDDDYPTMREAITAAIEEAKTDEREDSEV